MSDNEVIFQRAAVGRFLDRQNASLFQRKKQQADIVWSQIRYVDVQCPRCTSVQASQSIKTVKCRQCGASFNVIPENEPTRIADTEHNQKIRSRILLLQELQKKPK